MKQLCNCNTFVSGKLVFKRFEAVVQQASIVSCVLELCSRQALGCLGRQALPRDEVRHRAGPMLGDALRSHSQPLPVQRVKQGVLDSTAPYTGVRPPNSPGTLLHCWRPCKGLSSGSEDEELRRVRADCQVGMWAWAQQPASRWQTWDAYEKQGCMDKRRGQESGSEERCGMHTDQSSEPLAPPGLAKRLSVWQPQSAMVAHAQEAAEA
eukprot:356245-Chlamydomonas_euryale.AAC.4